MQIVTIEYLYSGQSCGDVITIKNNVESNTWKILIRGMPPNYNIYVTVFTDKGEIYPVDLVRNYKHSYILKFDKPITGTALFGIE